VSAADEAERLRELYCDQHCSTRSVYVPGSAATLPARIAKMEQAVEGMKTEGVTSLVAFFDLVTAGDMEAVELAYCGAFAAAWKMQTRIAKMDTRDETSAAVISTLVGAYGALMRAALGDDYNPDLDVEQCEEACARIAKMEAFEHAVRDDFAGVVCTCHEVYSGRGLKDPVCMYHEFEATVAALAALDAVTA